MPFSSSFFFIFVLALFPALGWIVVYRYLDSREPEPLSPTTEALLFGTISTLPIFIIQYFFSTFPQFSFLLWLQKHIINPIFFSMVFLLFVSLLEEFVKSIAFLWLIKKQEKNFNQIVDGIVYGALIGLGFALAENMYYFIKAIDVFQYSNNFWAIFTIRSFGTMLAHTLFTGIFGFYLAKAYFSPLIDEESKEEKLWHHLKYNLKEAISLHATFFHLMPQSNSEEKTFKRNVLIFEGYLIAVLLHFFYDALIKIELFGKSWTFLMIPLIFIIAWWLWSQFFVKLYTRIIEYVRIKKNIYRFRLH